MHECERYVVTGSGCFCCFFFPSSELGWVSWPSCSEQSEIYFQILSLVPLENLLAWWSTNSQFTAVQQYLPVEVSDVWDKNHILRLLTLWIQQFSHLDFWRASELGGLKWCFVCLICDNILVEDSTSDVKSMSTASQNEVNHLSDVCDTALQFIQVTKGLCKS